MLARLLFTFSLFGAPLAAQHIDRFDFDGDGTHETVQFIKGSADHQHLLIESETMGPIFVPKMAWNNSMAQQTMFMVDQNRPKIETAHLGIGRHKWILTLTLAYRRDAVRVVGVTYTRYDSLNPSDNATCDLNHLTRKGVVSVDGKPNTTFTADQYAPKLADWSTEDDFWNADLFPNICFGS